MPIWSGPYDYMPICPSGPDPVKLFKGTYFFTFDDVKTQVGYLLYLLTILYLREYAMTIWPYATCPYAHMVRIV